MANGTDTGNTKLQLVLEMLQLVSSIALGFLPGGGAIAQGLTIEQAIAKAIQKGLAVYQLHAGEPLDPSLIKPEELV